MAAYPKITTYPPLGQLTTIPPGHNPVLFTLIIEWNLCRPEYLFNVLLAFTAASSGQHHSQWKTITLDRRSDAIPNLLDPEDCQRAVYTGELTRQDLESQAQTSKSASTHRHYLFTVAFRVDALAPWQWIPVTDGTAPGELILRQDLQSSPNTGSVLDNLELAPDWNIIPASDAAVSASVSTFVLESQTTIGKSVGNELQVLPLAAIPSAIRYFSIVRSQPYWLEPRQGKGSFFHTSEDAIVTSFQLSNALILTFVAVGWCDDVYQVFRGDARGRIAVAARNDNSEDGRFKVVLSIGSDFCATMDSAMDQVRKIVAASDKMASLDEKLGSVMSSMDHTVAKISTERWLDSLAFCTWNGLGRDLTQSKLLNALQRLKDNNINISTLLIDDNWQTLGPTGLDYSDAFYRGWSDMEANTTIAPTGLKDLITSIRTAYPHIKDIGVWHALMGYWGTLCPTGSIAKQYPTTTTAALLMGNVPTDVTTIDSSALHDFYSDFYAFLREAGLTFVKTDVQHMLSTFQDSTARKSLIATYQSAWTNAHLKYFGGKAISCMSQTPQTLFYSLLNSTTPKIVHRNSDDFYPEIPASHPWHVWTNAHNAVFTKYLNVILDWDMFQTDHDFSAFHAAARCVSGGPILITDVPGCHDVNLISEMTATAMDGRAIALRTEAGETVDVFGLYTDGHMLKIRTNTACAGTVMALFNIAEKEVRSIIDVDDFGPPQNSAAEVLVRGYRTGEIFAPISSHSPITAHTGVYVEKEAQIRRKIHVRLKDRGWDILTTYPIKCLEHPSGRFFKVCVLGLLGKMTGAAAITSSNIFVQDKRLRVQINLKALGRLGVWFDTANAKGKFEVRVQGLTVQDTFLKLITLPENQGEHGKTGESPSDSVDRIEAETAADEVLQLPHIWEIDVEAFWRRNEMWDENCNSVVVELLVG